MKSVLMFIIEGCPYCKKALRYMEEIMEETPKYKEIPVRIVDENLYPEFAEEYDYYYVPTFFVEDEKVHEGAAEKDDIRRVFEKAEEE